MMALSLASVACCQVAACVAVEAIGMGEGDDVASGVISGFHSVRDSKEQEHRFDMLDPCKSRSTFQMN